MTYTDEGDAVSEPLDRSLVVMLHLLHGAPSALPYVAGLYRDHKRLKIRLLCIGERPEAWPGEAGSRRSLQRSVAVERAAWSTLESAREELIGAGLKPEHVDTRFWWWGHGGAGDVLRKLSAELPDAVVLDRDAMRLVWDMLDDPVNLEGLKRFVRFPVWHCGGAAQDTKGVLVAVDGSRASMAAVDHAAFMLEEEERHEVVLVHVRDGSPDVSEADDEGFLAEARNILINNGVSLDRVHDRMLDGPLPSQALLQLADEGGYAAIALGRIGLGGGSYGEGLLGSLSRELIRKAHGPALWLAP